MDAALIASAALLGLAGAPHCAAMCSAPCAAALGRGGTTSTAVFHAARLAGYATVGALAASGVAALASWSQWSPALRPAWVLLHVAVLGLGLWLAVSGRQPAWLAAIGRVPPQAAAGAGWQPLHGPAARAAPRAAAAGALWVAWPCGLLQSALLVAALASGAAAGAAAMASFALASAPGLLLGPWVWKRLPLGDGSAGRERLAVRCAGSLLALASLWALGHGVWQQVAAYCAAL